jgi:hypothetical protein
MFWLLLKMDQINTKMESRDIISGWEKRYSLNLESVKHEIKGGKSLCVVYPSFGVIAFSERKYAKTKRLGLLASRLLELRDELKAVGLTAKFVQQGFMLKLGIVGGGFGVGFIE